MSDAITRARLLMGSGRMQEALEPLGRALAENPSDAEAHALRALALADLEEFPEALESAQRASGEDPDWAFPHHVTAQVLLRWGKKRPALAAAEEAVAIDPENENHHAMVAACHASLSQWREGLAAAERGLALSAEHAQCTNLRALCLRQLGDVDEATSALRASLAEDPDNAWTHQNLGFASLANGRYDDAIASFRESLRLDPTDEESRVGLATALKGRVPLYRPIIAWQLFCSKLSSRFGIGLVFGLMILVNVVRRSLGPDSTVGTLVIIAYASLVWMSWAAGALFDVLLFARGDLRPILTGREKAASLGVITCLVLALAALAARITLGLPGMEWSAGVFAFAAIPMAAWAELDNAKARGMGLAIAIAALLLAGGSFALQLHAMSVIDWDLGLTGPADEIEALGARMRLSLSRASQLSLVSIVISVGSSWVMPFLGLVPERRGGRGQRRRPR
ncbi:outer membrane protein PgaA [Planctomycetes bacterium Poly30]|uniref:Outer membrane protein PgaA n=1 Tax=Saltatorellus ferox TaxID=2528018 RepID=A0A518EVQ4_9BACT|nr:outer membrane protein PgaA [Planctomycetes bacterium Poly30]